MKLTKIFHSCILLEEKGLKILIDPGSWVFQEKWAKAEDFVDVDLVLITHEHQDHYYPEALKIILQNGARCFTNKSLVPKMKEAGFSAEALLPGQMISIKGISILGTNSPHGINPLPVPENLGFVINGKVFHPGDSLEPDMVKSVDVLLAPITAPWMKLIEGVDFTKRLKPKIAIPIHDGFMKYPFALLQFEKVILEAGFQVPVKYPGEFVEIE